MPDDMTTPPPLSPGMMRPQQTPQMSGYNGMVGGQGPGQSLGGGVQPTPGMGQLATMGIRLAMEIDMNLKQLAQLAPPMAPWVMRVAEEMKLQLAQAMSGGGMPSTPAGGSAQWPDGTGRL
jgi:hypothetical protein